MSFAAQYQLAEGLSVTNIDDEMVLLDLRTGAYFGLNHIGAQLVHAVESHTPIEAAIDEISQRYQVSSQVVREDIRTLVDQLEAQNLILPVSSDR